jgi:hypothetical protein
MKAPLFFAVCYSALVAMSHAAPSDFDVKADPKCLAKDKTISGIEKITTEQWVYNVTIENKTARDHTDLDIKYVVYASDVQPGSKAPPKVIRKTGSSKLAAIKSHTKSAFTTEPIDLVKSQLTQGVMYGSGARPRANDTLEGIWVRIYKGGELLAETAKPPALTTKESWENANNPKAKK